MDQDFGEYARLHQHRLRRAAFLVCGDANLADDLVQQALIKLARHWPRVRSQNPDAYVRRILYHEAVSSWRRNRREQLTMIGQVPDVSTSAAQSRIAGEIDMQSALGRLSPQQRAVIVLRYFEDRTEADTASILGVSVGTVKTQAARALSKLRASIVATAHDNPPSPTISSEPR